MAKRTKVLQLQLTPNLNPSDLSEQIISALPKDEFHVISAFLTKENAEYYDFTPAENVKFFGYSDKQIKGSRKQICNELLDYIKKEQIDIVIGHRFKPTDILVKINAKHRLQGVIGVMHGCGYFKRWYRRLSFRFNLKSNCKLVAVSSAVKTDLLNAGIGEQNIKTINNAIDINRINKLLLPREQSRSELNIDKDKFVIGCIGRLVPVKWHLGLIQSYEPLIAKYPNTVLCIIGGGRLEDELRNYISEKNLQDNVLLTGKVPVAAQYLTAFDCFVLPSLSEGLPLSLLEAMTAKLPVIGSNIPSIAPVIDGVGLLFPAKDNKALTNHLQTLISMDKDELQSMGEAHLKHIIQHHTIEQYQESYLQLVRDFK